MPADPDDEKPLTLWVVLAVAASLLRLLAPFLLDTYPGLGTRHVVVRSIGALLVPAAVAGLVALIPRFRNARNALQVYTGMALLGFYLQLTSPSTP